MAKTGAAAAQPPDDLAGKRPALTVAPDEPSDAERLAADATAPARVADDGSMLVPLVTVNGSADIRIPAPRKWRAVAKNALFSQGDALTWAGRTLSTDDYATFIQLDPDGDELDAFWREWGRLTGEALADFLASRS